MFLATQADTLLFGITTVVGLAGALGVAYAVFKSASEQRLRDVDQRLINDQNMRITMLESEVSRAHTDLQAAVQKAELYRESLTQKAAVDHLAEIIVTEEKRRSEEHRTQEVLMKDLLAQMKGQRGTIG